MLKIPGLVLLDAKGLVMHSYYRGADPNAMLDAAGNSVNTAGYGLRGFIESYLRDILQEYAPLNIVAVWDGGNDYRTGLFPNYKAHRQAREKNEAVEVQLNELYKMVKALLAYIGAHNVTVRGTEADDVIAAFCERIPELPKIVHTVDQDLGQLANEHTLVMVKGAPMTEFAGHPLQLVRLYKSIVGDTSDGYGGVPMVGPKAFDYLVENYDLDGMADIEKAVATGDFSELEYAQQQTGCKVLAKLLENRGVWKLMYNLAGLHPELVHRATVKEIVRPEWYVRMADRAKVEEVLTRAGALHLIEVFEPHLPVFYLVERSSLEGSMELLRRELPNTPFLPFDYEAYDSLGHDWSPALPATQKEFVDVLSQEVTGGSFSFGANLQHTFYVPVLHAATENVHKGALVDILLAGEEHGLEFVAHNARFEEQVSKQCLGFQIEGPIDTMILASYVDENEFSGLKDQSQLWFRYDQMHYGDLLKMHGARDMRDLTGPQVLNYGCDDSIVSGRLFMLQFLILHLEQQWDFAYHQDRFTCHPFNRSYETGVLIDYDRMQELADADTKAIEEGMAFIREQLAEHCSQPSEAGALELKRADGDNMVRMKLAEGLNPSQAKAKLEEAVERWKLASVYQPYKEEFQPAEFVATAKGFTDAAKRVGIDVPLEKTTAAAMTEWLIKARAELPNWTDPRARELFTLFSECGRDFAKREGEAFAELKKFIETEIIHEDGKRIISGDELNFGSPKQMQELFYCKLALPVRQRTFPQKGSARDRLGLEGNPSTNDEAVMAALAEDCPLGDWRRDVLQRLQEVKEAMTRHSLYYKKYPYWKHPKDGAVHPGTRNCGTVTRRPAGKEPNMLAVSKGPLRSIYIPRFPGHVSVSLDFSGEELRLTGSEARDPVLIDAYTGQISTINEYGMLKANFKDIHSITGCSFAAKVLEQEMGAGILADLEWAAPGILDYQLFLQLLNRQSEVFSQFGVTADKLNSTIIKVRKMAKVVNFLIIYGGTAFTLAMKLGVPEVFAEKIMHGVFTGFPRLGPWQEETILEGKTQGYVTTAYGTRKHVDPNILSRDRSLFNRAARQTVNHKIQGCAADVLKVVLTTAHHTRLYEETKAVMYAPVYDELTNSVPIDNVFEFIERAQDCMNITPPGHPIPMLAEVSIGRDWHDVTNHELGDRPSQKEIEAIFDKWYADGWRR